MRTCYSAARTYGGTGSACRVRVIVDANSCRRTTRWWRNGFGFHGKIIEEQAGSSRHSRSCVVRIREWAEGGRQPVHIMGMVHTRGVLWRTDSSERRGGDYDARRDKPLKQRACIGRVCAFCRIGLRSRVHTSTTARWSASTRFTPEIRPTRDLASHDSQCCRIG